MHLFVDCLYRRVGRCTRRCAVVEQHRPDFHCPHCNCTGFHDYALVCVCFFCSCKQLLVSVRTCGLWSRNSGQVFARCDDYVPPRCCCAFHCAPRFSEYPPRTAKVPRNNGAGVLFVPHASCASALWVRGVVVPHFRLLDRRSHRQAIDEPFEELVEELVDLASDKTETYTNKIDANENTEHERRNLVNFIALVRRKPQRLRDGGAHKHPHIPGEALLRSFATSCCGSQDAPSIITTLTCVEGCAEQTNTQTRNTQTKGHTLAHFADFVECEWYRASIDGSRSRFSASFSSDSVFTWV